MQIHALNCAIANSALWATATTAAANGSVNAMHDSFTPLGGLVSMWLMQLGEVVFGGVGSGADHRDVGLALQPVLEQRAHQRRVIDDQNPDAHAWPFRR